MTNTDKYSIGNHKIIPKLRLAFYIVLRSVLIGLISGSGLGALFSCYYFNAFLWIQIVAIGLGFGLGLINGLLLCIITCLFFYPLKSFRFYDLTVKIISICIASGGTAIFGAWYFSSTSMTPSTAVAIGFSSVLASIIAGLAGGLLGENISQWYQYTTKGKIHEVAFFSNPAWIYVGFLSLMSPVGNSLLNFLVCGTRNVYSCLPSPRLYTSVIAGFKVAIPIIVLVILVVWLLRSLYKKRNS